MSATIDLTRAIGPNARPWRDAETKDIDMANRPVTLSLSTIDPAQGWTFTGCVVSDVRPVHPATAFAADEDEDVDDDDDIDDDDDDLDDDEVEDSDEADGDDESGDDATDDDDDLDDDFDDDDDEDEEEEDDLTAQKHTPTRVH